MGLNFLFIDYQSHPLQRWHPINVLMVTTVLVRIFPSLPGSRLTNFDRDASSTLLQLVNQWLNFTYSRSHAFRYGRQNKISALIRIELTTSALSRCAKLPRPLGAMRIVSASWQRQRFLLPARHRFHQQYCTVTSNTENLSLVQNNPVRLLALLSLSATIILILIVLIVLIVGV